MLIMHQFASVKRIELIRLARFKTIATSLGEYLLTSLMTLNQECNIAIRRFLSHLEDLTKHFMRV